MDRSPYRTTMEAMFERQIGEPLGDFVTRRLGDGASWRSIEREIYSATDGAVSVSSVSLARWFGEREGNGGAAA